MEAWGVIFIAWLQVSTRDTPCQLIIGVYICWLYQYEESSFSTTSNKIGAKWFFGRIYIPGQWNRFLGRPYTPDQSVTTEDGNFSAPGVCHPVHFSSQFLWFSGFLWDAQWGLFKNICSVTNSADGLIFVKRRAKDGHFFRKNTGVRRAKRRAKFKFCSYFAAFSYATAHSERYCTSQTAH